MGQDFQSNGFWFCARSDLKTRTFTIGNVVADTGRDVQGRKRDHDAARTGSGWDTCPGGTLLGHRMASDGLFWVCME